MKKERVAPSSKYVIVTRRGRAIQILRTIHEFNLRAKERRRVVKDKSK